MHSVINYSDLTKRKGFNDLVSLIQTDQTKIKYPDRTATNKLTEKMNRRKQMIHRKQKYKDKDNDKTDKNNKQ